MADNTHFYTKDSAKGQQIYAAFLLQCPNLKASWSYMGSWSAQEHTFRHQCGHSTRTGLCPHGIHANSRYITVATAAQHG